MNIKIPKLPPIPPSGGSNKGHAGGGVRVLRKGMSGMDVARCQNLLNRQMPFPPPVLWVDGIFGAITDRKVREYQGKNGLVVDGIVGSMTWSSLEGRPVGVGGGGAPGYGGGAGKGYGSAAGAIAKAGYSIGQGIGKGFGSILGGAGKYLK